MKIDHTGGLGPVEQTGLGDRMLAVFHAPRRAFEAVADGGRWFDWVLPVALAAGVWAAHNLATLSMAAPEEPAAISGWERLDEAGRETVALRNEAWRGHGWISFPLVGRFSGLAAVALVLVGLARWVLRSEAGLRQMLAIKSYAGLVTIPQWILLTLLVRLGACEPAAPFSGPGVFHAGFLLPAGGEPSFAGRFLMGVNFFDLWQAVLLGIGLAVVTGVPRSRALVVVLVPWLIWTAMGALAAAPGSGPAPS